MVGGSIAALAPVCHTGVPCLSRTGSMPTLQRLVLRVLYLLDKTLPSCRASTMIPPLSKLLPWTALNGRACEGTAVPSPVVFQCFLSCWFQVVVPHLFFLSSSPCLIKLTIGRT